MSNPWYARYTADYLEDTVHLSLAEDGAYTRLLDHYYGKGAPIKDGRQYAVCRVSAEAERAVVDSVLGEFFELRDGYWHNKRADEEIEEHLRIREARSRGGKIAQAKHKLSSSSAAAQLEDSSKTAPNTIEAATATATTTVLPSEPIGSAPSGALPTPPLKNNTPSQISDKGLFGGPLAWLLEKGLKEPRARTFLGKLQKTVGEAPALALIDRAMERDVIDPLAWLSAGMADYEKKLKRQEFEIQAYGDCRPIDLYDGGANGT